MDQRFSALTERIIRVVRPVLFQGVEYQMVAGRNCSKQRKRLEKARRRPAFRVACQAKAARRRVGSRVVTSLVQQADGRLSDITKFFTGCVCCMRCTIEPHCLRIEKRYRERHKRPKVQQIVFTPKCLSQKGYMFHSTFHHKHHRPQVKRRS